MSNSSRLVRVLRSMHLDASGSLMPIFAVCLGVLLLVMAVAMEMGRWAVARVEIQSALDEAVLVGSQTYSATADKTKATALAQKAFQANRDSRRFATSIVESATFAIDGNTLTGMVDSKLATAFNAVLQMDALDLSTRSAATMTNSRFEVSLMLDITGSMCDNPPGLDDLPCSRGQKIDAMKSAASNLINTLLSSTQLQSQVRVAIVPFSDGVRLARAQQVALSGSIPVRQTFQDTAKSCRGWNCSNKTSFYYYFPTDCITERSGSSKYTDDGPGPGAFFPTFMRLGTSATDSTPTEYGCTLGANSVIQPLTNNKSTLLDLVAGLAARGGTAGHLGTAWAWYTLSPNFKDIWSNSENAPAPYASGADQTVRKISIMMTDGDYNNQFTQHGYGDTSWAGLHVDAGAVNGDSGTQAQQLCSAMKRKNIEVYTVGFQVDPGAASFLQTCATDASHAYVAGTGQELADAFKNVGQKVLALYLSK